MYTDAIATLLKLRNTYNSQLDASDLEKLDEVIELLKKHGDNSRSDMSRQELSFQVLKIIAYVLNIVTNISDFMKM